MKIKLENVGLAARERLNRLTGLLEDQDCLLDTMINKMPACQERKDLIKIRTDVLSILNNIDDILYR